MTDPTACLPPPELRDQDGWHFLRDDFGQPDIMEWCADGFWRRTGLDIVFASDRDDLEGYRYLCPADFDALARLVRSQRASLAAMEGAGWDDPPGTDGVCAEARRAVAPFAGIPEGE